MGTVGGRRYTLSQIQGSQRMGGVVETLRCVIKDDEDDDGNNGGLMRVLRTILSLGEGDEVDVTVILMVSPLGRDSGETREHLEDVEGLRNVVGAIP